MQRWLAFCSSLNVHQSSASFPRFGSPADPPLARSETVPNTRSSLLQVLRELCPRSDLGETVLAFRAKVFSLAVKYDDVFTCDPR